MHQKFSYCCFVNFLRPDRVIEWVVDFRENVADRQGYSPSIGSLLSKDAVTLGVVSSQLNKVNNSNVHPTKDRILSVITVGKFSMSEFVNEAKQCRRIIPQSLSSGRLGLPIEMKLGFQFHTFDYADG